jgi:uncharacterized membrane protein YdjX (TVP38/TMEM64 family)
VRILVAVGLLAVVVAAAFLLPVPKPNELRSWALGAGSAAPLLMFVTYVFATLIPIPRTVFSLASGLLLGPVVGVLVAITATGVSGWMSFALARWVGRGMVKRHMDRPAVKNLNERLSGGGWMAVASLRLIPVAPFLPVNYTCGILSVRTLPYMLGTVLGSLPGTIVAVVVGDTLTNMPPTVVILMAICAIAGLAGLWFATRRRSVDQLDEPVE